MGSYQTTGRNRLRILLPYSTVKRTNHQVTETHLMHARAHTCRKKESGCGGQGTREKHEVDSHADRTLGRALLEVFVHQMQRSGFVKLSRE